MQLLYRQRKWMDTKKHLFILTLLILMLFFMSITISFRLCSKTFISVSIYLPFVDVFLSTQLHNKFGPVNVDDDACWILYDVF